jgi:XTP/dITP diphosphohydrolase
MATELIIATANPDKREEIISVLAPLLPSAFRIVESGEIVGLSEPDENGETFEANAVIKAKWYSERLQIPCLSDDSGLCVDALGGAPGVRSRRYAPSNEERIQKLLDEMKDVRPMEKRSAKFVCSVALAFPGGEVVTAEGELKGVISLAPSGLAGFGYDPVFLLLDRGVTIAELSSDEKNCLSHRNAALRKLTDILEKRFLNL